jgi:CheY-like chemotaxis protein
MFISSPAHLAAQKGSGFVRMTTNSALRVLLVDDDPLVLEVLSVALAENGLVCRTALDGFEAIRSLLEAPFDVIISDLRTPNISGFELLGIIRQRFPESAVIVISSEVDPIPQMPSSLMDAFFQKGAFTHKQLVVAIRKLSKRHKTDLPRARVNHCGSPGLAVSKAR